jgi:hypothetical protein
MTLSATPMTLGINNINTAICSYSLGYTGVYNMDPTLGINGAGYIRHSGFVIYFNFLGTGNVDFAWLFNGTTATGPTGEVTVRIWNVYPSACGSTGAPT